MRDDLPDGIAWEYRVRYRRLDWTQEQTRLYQRKGPAESFAAKLRREPLGDWSPMQYVRLERRPVPTMWTRAPEFPYGERARLGGASR